MEKKLEKPFVNPDVAGLAPELASLEKEIVGGNNLEKLEDPKKIFDYALNYIRSNGEEYGKPPMTYYDLEPISYKGMKYNVRLSEGEDRSQKTISVEVVSGNTRKYLYKFTKMGDGTFYQEKWTYYGDPHKPETYNFKVEEKKDLNSPQINDEIKSLIEHMQQSR